MKELEDLLSQANIVASNLVEPDLLKLALSNGIVVTVSSTSDYYRLVRGLSQSVGLLSIVLIPTYVCYT